MQLIRRSEWGAPATSAAAYIARTRGVKVHYLGTPYNSRPHRQCAAYVRGIRSSHLRHPTENYADIAYNALVCEHGAVFEGRGAHQRSAANGTYQLNSAHYSVCALLGSAGLTEPPNAMLHGLRDAIEWLRREGAAGSDVRGHRDGHPTACPGDALYAWVRAGARRPAGGRPSAGGGTYTVRRGDTLGEIAAAHGVPVAELVRINRLSDPNVIYPGQRLTLPGEEDDVPMFSGLAKRDDDFALTPGEWKTIRLNTEWHDESDVHYEPGQTFVAGPAYYKGDATVYLRDLPVGARVFARVVEDEDGGTVHEHPAKELGGNEFSFCGKAGPGRRIKLQVMYEGEVGAVLGDCYVQALTWEG